MTDNPRLDEIKRRLETINDPALAADLKFLVGLAEQLQRKNEVLSNHNIELTQEMENMRSDFGNNR